MHKKFKLNQLIKLNYNSISVLKVYRRVDRVSGVDNVPLTSLGIANSCELVDGSNPAK